MPTMLVTGANRGIGLELARQYAADGWRVHACCRRPDRADALEGLAAEANGLVKIHPLEVTDDGQIAALAENLAGEPIDILCNNAGIYGQKDAWFGNTRRDDWLHALNVNTLSPMNRVKLF